MLNIHTNINSPRYKFRYPKSKEDFYARFRLESFKVKDILFFNMLNKKEKEYVLKKYPSMLSSFNYIPIKKNLKLFFLDGDQFGINQILSLTWTLRYLNYLSSTDFYALKVIKLDNDDSNSKILNFESDILTYTPIKFELGNNINNKVDNIIAMDIANTINNLMFIEQSTNIYIVSNDKAILDFENSYNQLNLYNLSQKKENDDDDSDNLINIISIKKSSLFTNITNTSEINLEDLPSSLLFKIINKNLIQNYPDELLKNYNHFRLSINYTLSNFSSYKNSMEKYNQALDNQELDNQPLDNQQLDNQPLDNQALDNQALDNQQLDNQPLDNQQLDNQELDNQALDNQELDNQELDNQELDNQELDKEIKECLELCEIPLNEHNLNIAHQNSKWLNKIYSNYKEKLKVTLNNKNKNGLTKNLKHNILKDTLLKTN